MRTLTIFEAFLGRRDQLDDRYVYHGKQRKKMDRQLDKFYDEVTRRMDERDTMRGELAEARAFISAVIDAPKDYPAEERM